MKESRASPLPLCTTDRRIYRRPPSISTSTSWCASWFKSITEAIDTTTSGGKLVFHIFGALAEFERDIIRERTQAGLTAAPRKPGRRRSRARLRRGCAGRRHRIEGIVGVEGDTP